MTMADYDAGNLRRAKTRLDAAIKSYEKADADYCYYPTTERRKARENAYDELCKAQHAYKQLVHK